MTLPASSTATALYKAVMELALRGYTPRAIRKMLLPEHPDIQRVPDALLTQWILDEGAELDRARESLDKFSETRLGLMNKYERIRRLAEFAESIEPRASIDPKWAGEYRRAISQIQQETEGLNLTVDLSDRWVKLLTAVANVASPSTGLTGATGQPIDVESRAVQGPSQDDMSIVHVRPNGQQPSVD